MRLLPQSLFGRLMLVLLSGLVIAQLLSAAINFQERDQLLLRASGMQTAQRIADSILLLDSLNAVERKRIVALLNVPPQVVTLDQAPVDANEKFVSRLPTGIFLAVLQSSLGELYQIRVSENVTSASVGPRGPGYGRRRAMLEGKEFVPGMYRFSQNETEMSGSLSYRVQVRLQDSQWVTFETQISKEAASLPLRLLITLGILLLAVLAISFIAVRWVTRPLHVLSSAADALGKDINCPPLPETGPLELKQAAHAFNTMQTRLLRFLEERTRIFAAMSHDLKTPITRLRLRAEMLDDEDLRQRFEKDLKEMEAMVAATLDFMRGLGSTEAWQPIDIMALLESLQADYEEMGQKILIEGRATKPYPGIVPLLKRCLSNLLDNAVFYGKEVTIVIEENSENLTLRIRDCGPGIPENELEKVFDPFYRLESSRNRETGGTGLGLTIVRSIAQIHGGKISMKNRLEGGLEACLYLPKKDGAAH